MNNSDLSGHDVFLAIVGLAAIVGFIWFWVWAIISISIHSPAAKMIRRLDRVDKRDRWQDDKNDT